MSRIKLILLIAVVLVVVVFGAFSLISNRLANRDGISIETVEQSGDFGVTGNPLSGEQLPEPTSWPFSALPTEGSTNENPTGNVFAPQTQPQTGSGGPYCLYGYNDARQSRGVPLYHIIEWSNWDTICCPTGFYSIVDGNYRPSHGQGGLNTIVDTVDVPIPGTVPTNLCSTVE